MASMPYWLLLFGAGVASGFLNVTAGGGSTLTLPLLIFLGLNSALANGTNRVAILMQNVVSVGAFRKERPYPLREGLRYSLWTLPGAVAGSIYATTLTDDLFQKILGVIILGVIVTMLIPNATGMNAGAMNSADSGKSGKARWIIPSLLGIGFYGGFIQVGVGFLFMAALYHFLKTDLVTVNMHKVFIVLIYTVPALAVFVWTDNVDWLLGLILGAGSAVGGWLAVKVSIKGGDTIIRITLIAALLIMSLKLLGVF